MSALSGPAPTLTAASPHWARRATVGAVLGLALSPALALPWPAITLIVATLAASLRTPAAPLSFCVGLYGLTLGHDPGVQPEEILFLLYYAVFLGWWVVSRTFIYREFVLTQLPDLTLAAFLLSLPVSLGIGLAQGASFSVAVGELINFSMLALYFPAKELSRRFDWGPKVVLGLLLLLGMAAINQNLAIIYEAFRDAEAAWEIARGRVAMSEMLIASGALVSIAYAVTSTRKLTILAYLVAFAAFTAGLAMTQSRAYYVDLVVGLGMLPLLIGREARYRMGISVIGATVVIGAGAYLLLGDVVSLVLVGVADRFLSIGTATQMDISYLNRLLENKAAWERVWQSPIVGNGLGTPFQFFDAIVKGTWVKPFVHNGYIMLWYKFGFLGLAAILTTWLGRRLRGLWYAADRSRRDHDLLTSIPMTAAGVTLDLAAPLPRRLRHLRDGRDGDVRRLGDGCDRRDLTRRRAVPDPLRETCL